MGSIRTLCPSQGGGSFLFASLIIIGTPSLVCVSTPTGRSCLSPFPRPVPSINPFLIFTLTPFLALWWRRQAARASEPSTLRKMAIGCAIGGLAYLLMIGAGLDYAERGSASWLWLVGYFFLLTAGELFVLPVGLSLFSQLSPAQAASAMIGVWYLAKFAGASLAGWLGTFWLELSHTAFFGIGAASAFAAALAMLIAERFLPSGPV